MSNKTITFKNKHQAEFIKELRQRVNRYFKENNISRHGNTTMKVKSAFMIALYFTPLVIMLTGVVSSFWGTLAMWFLMGLGMAGIGLSIMHDANHGSYSKKKSVNRMMGYLVNFLGAWHVNWKIQHNVLHHSFTNVHGYDDDIDTFALRFSPTQKPSKWYRFQAFYAPIFYANMTVYWLLMKDFVQIIQYNNDELLESQNTNLKKGLASLIFNKIMYVGLIIVAPMLLINLPWTSILLGFLIMHFTCGLLLALIFQTAHVIEETEFFESDEDGMLENEWAIHQLKTTANFAENNRPLSWFVGGLNFQVEHHLFPNICHVHYKKLSHIVRETAHEFNLPYNSHKTFIGAIASHFTFLHKLGTGKIEQQVIPVKVEESKEVEEPWAA